MSRKIIPGINKERIWNKNKTHKGQKPTSKCHCGKDHQTIGNMVRTFELESNYFVGRTRGRVLNMDSYPQRKHKLNLGIKCVLISLVHIPLQELTTVP